MAKQGTESGQKESHYCSHSVWRLERSARLAAGAIQKRWIKPDKQPSRLRGGFGIDGISRGVDGLLFGVGYDLVSPEEAS